MTLDRSDFELLLQANRILSSKLTIADVLEAVMELATKVVKAEASSLLLLDERNNELYFDVALGSVKEDVKQIRLKVGEGIAGWVAKERRALIVNDVSKDKRFTGKVDKSTKFQTRSILAVPMLAKGKLIGVVEAINKENNGEFDESDREAFEAFSSQAAIAIENARLFSEITREKEKLNTVFKGMSDGIVFLDEDGRILIINEAASQFFGLDQTDGVGKSFIKGPLRTFSALPAWEKILKSDSPLTAVEFTRKKGKLLHLSGLVHKISATKDLPHGGALVLVRDTTEEKKGAHLKQNFLSLISHKLRTPLTVILGYGPALLSKNEGLEPFQLKALKSICQQGEHLSGLVDKLLRFALVESTTLDQKKEQKAVADLLSDAMREVDSLRKSKNALIHIDEKIKKAPKIRVDGPLTIEVFKNLFENGIKFNDKDVRNVWVSYEKLKDQLILKFKDDGVGIPSEEKSKIFEKFYQVEESFTGQVPGAGLGLSLCKKVMEGLQGEIKIDSEVGIGTTVSVAFPLK